MILTCHDGERGEGEVSGEKVILVEEGAGRGSEGGTGRPKENAWKSMKIRHPANFEKKIKSPPENEGQLMEVPVRWGGGELWEVVVAQG